jgi:hypothetical protein
MEKFSNSNFEFRNWNLSPSFGRFSYRSENRQEFAGFTLKLVQAFAIKELGFTAQFQPILRLRSFFFDKGDFVNEISTRLSPIGLAIIRSDRGC